MTPRLWFALALRILGAWLVTEAVTDFTAMVNVMNHLYNPAYTLPLGFFVYGAVKIVLAMILLKLAPVIALYFYPNNSSKLD
jgi:hypothetical protein